MAEKQKILVVDDEPEIREVLQMMLSSEGYEITEACNAQEAVEKASGKDLVILDIRMPGRNRESLHVRRFVRKIMCRSCF